MASVQVPTNMVVNPADLMTTAPVGSTRVTTNDVSGQASTEPVPQIMQPGLRIIRR